MGIAISLDQSCARDTLCAMNPDDRKRVISKRDIDEKLAGFAQVHGGLVVIANTFYFLATRNREANRTSSAR